MKPDACILGIESSCDETAAAVLRADGTILAEAVFSQQAEHAAFGGVVPEIAARAHLQHLPGLVANVLQNSGINPAALHAVAATAGPGLIGGLIVGASFAKGVALAHGLPFLAINHLEAHALTVRLPGLMPGAPPAFPYLLLLLSGGHCQCVLVEGLGRYHRLGSTLDDAVGEAFDKAAKLLGLPWPGGPHLERLATTGNAALVPLPRPLMGRPGCDFSFSGLKTAVARYLESTPQYIRADVAASFQEAIVDVLLLKALAACKESGIDSLVIAGGVAANSRLRAVAAQRCEKAGIELRIPPADLCTDNGAMVASLGSLMMSAGRPATHGAFDADSGLKVEQISL